MSMLEQSLDAIIGDRREKRDGGRPARPRGPASRRNMRGPNNSRPKRVTVDSISGVGNANEIKISNLHPDLTIDDLTKLMQTVGEVTRVEIKYNTHGQSTGVAFVEFKQARDANDAISKFDGRLAAGQVITVTTTMKLADRIGGGRIRGNGRVGRGGRGGIRKDRNGGPKKTVRPRKTLEDLDKELSAYMGVGEGQQESQDQNQDQNQEQHHEQPQEQPQDEMQREE